MHLAARRSGVRRNLDGSYVAVLLLPGSRRWWGRSMAKRRKRKRRAKKTAAAKPSASWLDHTRRLPGTIAEVLKLTPAQFEEGVADLLQRLGYRSVQRVGRSGDLGVDITCQDKEGRSVAVQCKQYTGARIGSKDIQTFIGMQRVHHGADRGMFVTTSEFTTPARNLAERHGITLIDDKELLNRIRQAYRGQKATPDTGEPQQTWERGVIVRGRAPLPRTNTRFGQLGLRVRLGEVG